MCDKYPIYDLIMQVEKHGNSTSTAALFGYQVASHLPASERSLPPPSLCQLVPQATRGPRSSTWSERGGKGWTQGRGSFALENWSPVGELWTKNHSIVGSIQFVIFVEFLKNDKLGDFFDNRDFRCIKPRSAQAPSIRDSDQLNLMVHCRDESWSAYQLGHNGQPIECLTCWTAQRLTNDKPSSPVVVVG